MLVSLIAAMARNRAIGIENRLPWRLPADLRHFKALTTGKPVIMGRLTYESIGRPLPGRRNIVVSRDAGFRPAGCEVAASPGAALALAGDAPEAMVIGGASLYARMLPECDRLYLTLIDADVDADAFFPDYGAYAWRELEREDFEPDLQNPFAYSFVVLERVRTPGDHRSG